ncbi:hypothetical protein H4S01_002397 [Coemansia sp. RSA 2610]|nr:hypothetical protein H4S01_002397 [Coemansia sp. RSA 2610]
MEESDDFHYDSVVSDPAVYDGLLDSNADMHRAADAAASEPSNTILTPSTNHVSNYQPPATAPTDSMPSLAISTPTSERFQLEYEREMRNHGHYDSQQSQFGLKSGMYLNGSDTDISEKLKGDVVFSGKWSTVGESSRRTHGRRASHSAIDDTFDIPSFNDSTDLTLSRLIRESSADDAEKRATLQSQYADRRPPSAPTTPVTKPNAVEPDALVTPKMTRALSDGSVLHSAPGEARVLRSALRGSRSTGPAPGKVQFDEASLSTARKASLAGMQSISSLETSIEAPGGLESIELGPAETPTNSAAADMDTQPIEDNASPQDREPDEEYPTEPAAEATASPSNLGGLDGVTGVGMGMAGGMFRKFAGWTRNHLAQRPASPALPAAAALPTTELRDADKYDATLGSQGSSQSASTVSPVRTEPMHSQILSTTTTPTSGRSGTASGGSSLTTPRHRPSSAKRGAVTPSRSVNPLTRHLALKAIRSAPPAERSMLAGDSRLEPSPTSRGRSDASPLVGSVVSEDSAFLGLSELQLQFDGFASRLKHDASAVHADVLESEEAWTEMQNELQQLRMDLLQAETARDFLQQRAEGTDRERLEWEQDRQQLLDEKVELQDTVDRWRKRIGDAEKERQGLWTADMQTREQLLETIGQLEEQQRELESRHRDDRRQWEAKWESERDGMAREVDELLLDYDKIETEKREIEMEYDKLATEKREIEVEYDKLDAESRQLQGEYDQLDAENRQLQADVHEAHAQLEEQRDAIQRAQTELDAAKSQAAEQQAANAKLRQEADSLAERNQELQQSRDDSHLFATAINETMMQPAGSGEKTDELKQQLRRMKEDYDLLTESLRDAVEAKNEYKAQVGELAASAEAARKQISELQQQRPTQVAGDTELEQLREREQQLQRALEDSEQANEALATRLRAAEERARSLAARSDEQAQRVARLETELGDVQMRESESQQKELAVLQTMVSDLEQQVQRQQADGDAQRQREEAREAELIQVKSDKAACEAELDQIKSNKAAASQMPGEAEAECRAVQASIGELRQRRVLLEKEKRLLADGLRDVLLNNATLRTELTAILLRRAGKLRDLHALQRSASHGSEGDVSMASGLLNHVPSASQLLDGDSKYMHSLDRHLDEVANIIEDDAQDAPASAPPPAKRSVAAHVFAERTQKRLLTPIREESAGGASVRALRDAATQCALDGVEAEQRAQRARLAGVEQERDQFRAAHEDAAERVAHLSAQLEELGEDQERMRAERTTLALIVQRVGRQTGVLLGALARLAACESPTIEPSCDDDAEDARALQEDDAMRGAAFEHVLDAEPAQPSDEALEDISVRVSQAYARFVDVRHAAMKARRERTRLMKRLAEFERSKLPSFELSAQWGLRMRDAYAAGGESLLDADAEPPASLFLADESAVMAELARSREQQTGDASLVSPDALRDPAAAVRELARLAALAAKHERGLRAARAGEQKLAEINHELLGKLDRAYADRQRALQESAAAGRRASARSASRATTPSRGTDWDDVDSIARELERCADKNRAYFANVEQLCAVLNQHTLDQALATGDDGSGSGGEAEGLPSPENTYRKLLVELAAALDATDDLDARKSIRDNFTGLAAAVRRRLDAADAELRHTRSELDVSRLACEAVPDATQRARAAERRAAAAEKQLAEVHAAQATDQATVRSLNSTIARLRQQCMAAEGDVQDARLERDGWNQQCVAYERMMHYHMEENERLEAQLQDLVQQQKRSTHEFVLSHGDHAATINWDNITQAAAERERHGAEAAWKAREFALRQTYECQAAVYRWGMRMWSSVVRALAAHYTRDLPRPQDSARFAELSRAVDELEARADGAAAEAGQLQDALDGTRSRNEFVEMLAQIGRALELQFPSTWRDSVRACLMALAASSSSASAKLSPAGSLSSSSGSSAEPPLTAKQKQLIRDKLQQRESAIRDKFAAELQTHKHELERAQAKFKSELKSAVAECRYLRKRLAAAHDRINFVHYQKEFLVRLAGGHTGILRLVDASQDVAAADARRERIRRRWRLVLLAVHMKNQLLALVRKTHEAHAIKGRAVARMNSLESRRSKRYPDPPMILTPPSATVEPVKSMRGVFANYRFHPQQFIGLKATPHTPSRLRNRASDIASSFTSSTHS